MPRDASLTLLNTSGALLGALPPVTLELPYWQEAADIRAAVLAEYGVDVEVLRLLAADRPAPPGGAVSYLAQAVGPVPSALPLRAAVFQDSEDPRRAEYARPGGPAASRAWAAQALAEAGLGTLVVAEQQRTWNLSAIWKLRTDETTVWLKQVPGFFAHEAALLAWLARLDCPQRTPTLLAADDHGTMLLADIPGQDWYTATPAQRLLIAADFDPIQALACGREAELVALGVPDARLAVVAPRLRELAAPAAATTPGLGALLDSLDDRLAAIDACGLPDTLVHGDLHPGNVRVGPSGERTVIDWGDAVVGHPGFDILRLSERLEPPDAAPLLDEWAARWRARVPGCAPERAVELLRPVAALRAAAVYANFLDHIEDSERPYHEGDVPHWLAVAGGEHLRATTVG